MSDIETAILQRLDAILASNKEVLTLKETASYMGCSTTYLHKLTSKNEIPFFKPRNKIIYFDKAELNDWLRQNPQKTNAEINGIATDFVHQKMSR